MRGTSAKPRVTFDHRQRKLLLLACLGLAAAIFLILVGVHAALPNGKLHVAFLNIGQGDATLIRTPRGKNILVDAGPGNNIADVLPGELPFFDRRLDLIVLSHPHRDHLDGFLTVLREYQVDAVLLTGAKTELPEYQAFVEGIRDKVRLIATADRDYVVEPGLVFDILSPKSELNSTEVQSSKLNPTSVVFRLDYGATHILFTGDIDAFVEDQILATGVDVRSTVLKVAHHGSKYSSTKRFVTQVDPDVAVFSLAAGNQFGHPHAQTLKTFDELNIQTYRTDTFGTVRAECDNAARCTYSHDQYPRSFASSP